MKNYKKGLLGPKILRYLLTFMAGLFTAETLIGDAHEWPYAAILIVLSLVFNFSDISFKK